MILTVLRFQAFYYNWFEVILLLNSLLTKINQKLNTKISFAFFFSSYYYYYFCRELLSTDLTNLLLFILLTSLFSI